MKCLRKKWSEQVHLGLSRWQEACGSLCQPGKVSCIGLQWLSRIVHWSFRGAGVVWWGGSGWPSSFFFPWKHPESAVSKTAVFCMEVSMCPCFYRLPLFWAFKISFPLGSFKDTGLLRSMKLPNWGWLVVWQIKEGIKPGTMDQIENWLLKMKDFYQPSLRWIVAHKVP